MGNGEAMKDTGRKFETYFEILSPRDRRLMLEQLTELDEETQEFCRTLYRERYQDKKDPERRVDNWLWKAVYLPGVYKKRKLLKSAIKNEVKGTLQDLHLENPDALSETEKDILYLEFRNVAKRYLSTCNGVNYGNKLFGLKKASADEKKKKACEDIWMTSRGVALASGEEERLRLWCDAFYDELMTYYPGGKEYYNELERSFRK
jgi:hypothetical protein